MYYCFGCGAGGNVISFVMEYENYTFVEAVKMLADRAGIALPEMEYSKEAKGPGKLKKYAPGDQPPCCKFLLLPAKAASRQDRI